MKRIIFIAVTLVSLQLVAAVGSKEKAKSQSEKENEKLEIQDRKILSSNFDIVLGAVYLQNQAFPDALKKEMLPLDNDVEAYGMTGGFTLGLRWFFSKYVAIQSKGHFYTGQDVSFHNGASDAKIIRTYIFNSVLNGLRFRYLWHLKENVIGEGFGFYSWIAKNVVSHGFFLDISHSYTWLYYDDEYIDVLKNGYGSNHTVFTKDDPATGTSWILEFGYTWYFKKMFFEIGTSWGFYKVDSANNISIDANYMGGNFGWYF